MAKKISKTQLVKEHLINQGSITSWEAIKKFKATRLSAIIFMLKKRGMHIVPKTLVSKDGIRYAMYMYSESKLSKK